MLSSRNSYISSPKNGNIILAWFLITPVENVIPDSCEGFFKNTLQVNWNSGLLQFNIINNYLWHYGKVKSISQLEGHWNRTTQRLLCTVSVAWSLFLQKDSWAPRIILQYPMRGVKIHPFHLPWIRAWPCTCTCTVYIRLSSDSEIQCISDTLMNLINEENHLEPQRTFLLKQKPWIVILDQPNDTKCGRTSLVLCHVPWLTAKS